MAMKMIFSAALALAVSAGAVNAGPPKCPPGHAKKGECGQSYQRGDDHGRRKGHDDHGRHKDHGDRGHRWQRGERIEPTRYVVIERYRDYGYQPPPPGYRYVKVDDNVLLIAVATGIIAEILQNN